VSCLQLEASFSYKYFKKGHISPHRKHTASALQRRVINIIL